MATATMMGGRNTRSRYSTVAIVLHWAIAILIVANFFGALWFDELLKSDVAADKQLGFRLVQMHKAVGLSILSLTVLRLLWRLVNPPPPLPAGMPGWQRAASRISHGVLYALMLLVPLGGWAMVSVSPLDFPISFFGLFDWPQLPLANDKTLADQLSEGHELFAKILMGLAAIHLLAALKHQFVDRDNLIARMWPGGGEARA
ncbi:MAG: cytochrome b [Sphingomonadaceae bacterium]